MKVNKEQIDDLYTFTIKHFVEYYDLQTELVDHLANDIESIWEKHPNVPYKDARDKAFKKFGVFGFMNAIEQRQKAMHKRYLKFLWTELKQWFTLPKVLSTILLFLIFHTAFSTSLANYFFIAFYSIMVVLVLIKSVQLKRQFNTRKKASHKKWFLEEIIFKQAGSSTIGLIAQLHLLVNFSNNVFENYYFVLGFSVFSTLLSLWLFVSFQVLPNKAEQLLKTTYPEFSL